MNNNRYSKSVPLARYYDQQLVTHLEAIYNILQIVDERLKKLEEKQSAFVSFNKKIEILFCF
jgi:hypothetical protein